MKITNVLDIAHRALDYKVWFIKTLTLVNNTLGVDVNPVSKDSLMPRCQTRTIRRSTRHSASTGVAERLESSARAALAR